MNKEEIIKALDEWISRDGTLDSIIDIVEKILAGEE